jgi:hypothetical protein
LACSDGVDGFWSVAVSTGSGWDTTTWAGGPVVPLPITNQCFSGDFNGDGAADLACWTGSDGSWNVALSTLTGWQSEAWNVGPSPTQEWNVVPVGGQCFAVDFDGNHLTDLTCYLGNGSSGPNAGVWDLGLSSGGGWNLESWAGGQGPAVPITGQCLTGDFNGDRKTDIACFTGFAGGIWGVSLSTGTGWESTAWNGGPSPTQEWTSIPVGGQCFVGDFNGDGKTDLTCYSENSNWQVALSTGIGW